MGDNLTVIAVGLAVFVVFQVIRQGYARFSAVTRWLGVVVALGLLTWNQLSHSGPQPGSFVVISAAAALLIYGARLANKLDQRSALDSDSDLTQREQQ